MMDFSKIDWLPATYDLIFKLLLIGKDSKPLLLHLLNAVLQPRVPIRSIHVQNPAIPKDFANEKGMTLDILVKDTLGQVMLIEMQANRHMYFRERSEIYLAKTFGAQLRRGWTYARTRPAYGIYFLNYLEFPEARADKFVHRLSVRDEAEGFVLSDKMQWIFIELPKFDALRAKGGLTPDETTLEWWCRMLVNPADKELERIAMRDPIMKQAREKLAHLSSDPATRELLRMREKADVDWNSMLQESHESGLAKGRQEGEAKASLQILVNLLKTSSFAALSDEEIADLTSSDLALVRQARRNSQG